MLSRCSSHRTYGMHLVPLSQQQREFRQAVKDFMHSEIKPLVFEDKSITNDKVDPKQVFKVMGKAGLLGITVPERYGGAGLGYVEHCLVIQELSKIDGSFGLSVAAHSNLCMMQILNYGTEKQKLKYLPSLCSGDAVGCLAMSEAESGSDVLSMKNRIVKKDNKFVMNGSKDWITNGNISDVMVVYGSLNPKLKKKGISGFIVDKSTPGFQPGDSIDKMGMRNSRTSELRFNNCELSSENLLGNPERGVYQLLANLDYERLILAAGPLGLMEKCLDVVIPYVNNRHQFGQPLSSFQMIQSKLARMYTSLASSQSFVYATAKETDNNRKSSIDCASALYYASKCAMKVADDSIQCLGANGYTTDYPLAKILADAKLYEIGGGTQEIRKLVIARELSKNIK